MRSEKVVDKKKRGRVCEGRVRVGLVGLEDEFTMGESIGVGYKSRFELAGVLIPVKIEREFVVRNSSCILTDSVLGIKGDLAVGETYLFGSSAVEVGFSPDIVRLRELGVGVEVQEGVEDYLGMVVLNLEDLRRVWREGLIDLRLVHYVDRNGDMSEVGSELKLDFVD